MPAAVATDRSAVDAAVDEWLARYRQVHDEIVGGEEFAKWLEEECPAGAGPCAAIALTCGVASVGLVEIGRGQMVEFRQAATLCGTEFPRDWMRVRREPTGVR